MLEQRRAQEKGYITLKEAAALANYTPDYVGQLIRAGKIRGKQVYSGVAWVTTESEVQAYLQDKDRTVLSPSRGEALLVHPFFKFFVYAIIAMVAFGVLCMQYIVYVSSADAEVTQFSTSRSVESRM